MMRLASVMIGLFACGCAQNHLDVANRDATNPAAAPASQPAANPDAIAPARPPAAVYDTAAPKPIAARDWLEEIALDRGPDLRLVDRLMDERTRVPEFDRRPLPDIPAGMRIADGVDVLDRENPFPEPEPLAPKDVTIRVGVARSTYRTRTPEEVLAAVQPFIDLEQRQVNVRGEAVLYQQADEIFYALTDGAAQMVVCHVFDYLLARSWFASLEDNGTVLLAFARPANARTTDLDRDFEGVPGTSIELVVAADSQFHSFADLRGRRLALAASYEHAPGAFLTRLLADAGAAPEQSYFGAVALRRYG